LPDAIARQGIFFSCVPNLVRPDTASGYHS
jgi:hypothetical protein